MANRKAVAITPNNSANLPNAVSKIYVGGAGNIKVTLAGQLDADAVTLIAVPVGTVLEMIVVKVFSTGTTATNLVGFYS